MKDCSLCGGKLDRNNRCTLCGLDNTKNDSMYKHMINRNECANEPLTHVHEEPQKPKVTYTYRNTPPTNQNSKQKQKKPKGCAAFIGVFIPISTF